MCVWGGGGGGIPSIQDNINNCDLRLTLCGSKDSHFIIRVRVRGGNWSHRKFVLCQYNYTQITLLGKISRDARKGILATMLSDPSGLKFSLDESQRSKGTLTGHVFPDPRDLTPDDRCVC